MILVFGSIGLAEVLKVQQLMSATDFVFPMTTTTDNSDINLVSGVGPYRNNEPGDTEDLCGDVSQGESTLFDLHTPLTIVCQDALDDGSSDAAEDGTADVSTCVSWDNQAGTTCKTETDVTSFICF